MMGDVIDDIELARRSIAGFGELCATVGRCYAGPDVVVRWPNAVGARIDAANANPWFDAAVVPYGAAPPPDDPRLPHCLWTMADAAPGRVEAAGIAMPCMGLVFDDPAVDLSGAATDALAPPLAVVGTINERGYGETGFGRLIAALHDERARAFGLRDGSQFVAVGLTLAIGDGISLHFVATEPSHQRRGLARRLALAMLQAGRDAGARTATLQASAAGLPMWAGVGFRQVALLRGFVRAPGR